MLSVSTNRRKRERGFSILEMMLATVILLIGLVAIAQLVPATIQLNFRNRHRLVGFGFAQRELDQFIDQPLFAATFTDTTGNTCALGSAAPANAVQGSPVAVVNNQVVIDFAQALVNQLQLPCPLSRSHRPGRCCLRRTLGCDRHWQRDHSFQQTIHLRNTAERR